ncbi:hypothetical protein DCAR_0208052 [Daucus carota subsp. sativus]|uniref:Pectate lyase n=1 Tax=Daucus carota subsp. sativus TaxID=79200 RepID=A0A166EAB1_DAUCS|nr:PREDICTED: pectate lyase [Daucus carota subsp. sativus]WOG88817.1 hypothetical protein DCAR_0208052 [Daucus carota subsp. sativus]
MGRGRKVVFFLIFLSFASGIYANIGEFDDFLKQQAEEAKQIAEQSYNPHPEEVANSLNKQVGDLLHSNRTRRHLAGAECMATNPIDRCWRCHGDWHENRKRLADCGKGFGRNTIGGRDGEIYVVTDPSDNNVEEPTPGTLRHAVIQMRPLWIIFSKSMVIRLEEELIMRKDKTIDGRGVNVHIAYGAGITIQYISNVIIHGIRIHHIIPRPGGMVRDAVNHIGLRTISDGDGISIYGSSNVWIDHVSLEKCSDGLIDAIEGSTAITISNCKFNNHDHVMLFGGSDKSVQDRIMQVTVAFNRFGKGLIQRMPRARHGFFHVVNNDYNRWQMYAIGGSANPTIISQGNRFKAPENPFAKGVTKRDYATEEEWKNWQWRSEGDLFKNGAYFNESGPPFIQENPAIRRRLIKAKPGSFAGRLTRYAGALKCKLGHPC